MTGRSRVREDGFKKNYGFFLAHLSNRAIWINARRPLSVISRVSVLSRKIFALIWQIYIKSLNAS